MATEAVIARFAGDPSSLADGYRAAAARYARDGGAGPEYVHLLRDDDGIVVVLVWPDPPGHEVFARFMRSVIGEFGLPFPEVSHLEVLASGWAAVTGAPQR
jgi:hypothetical protein